MFAFLYRLNQATGRASSSAFGKRNIGHGVGEHTAPFQIFVFTCLAGLFQTRSLQLQEIARWIEEKRKQFMKEPSQLIHMNFVNCRLLLSVRKPLLAHEKLHHMSRTGGDDNVNKSNWKVMKITKSADSYNYLNPHELYNPVWTHGVLSVRDHLTVISVLLNKENLFRGQTD